MSSVAYFLMPLFNKSVKLYYNSIKKQKMGLKNGNVRPWKVSCVCTLWANNPMSPGALNQANLISNQSIGSVLKADYFDHPNW